MIIVIIITLLILIIYLKNMLFNFTYSVFIFLLVNDNLEILKNNYFTYNLCLNYINLLLCCKVKANKIIVKKNVMLCPHLFKNCIFFFI